MAGALWGVLNPAVALVGLVAGARNDEYVIGHACVSVHDDTLLAAARTNRPTTIRRIIQISHPGINRHSHTKLPRTILDESYSSIAHERRQPSHRAHGLVVPRQSTGKTASLAFPRPLRLYCPSGTVMLVGMRHTYTEQR